MLKRSDSRGLSTIVATLLIILLTLVAVGVIWIVVRNVIQSGAEQVSLGKFTLDLKITQVQKINDSALNVIVKRNVGDGEFVGIIFVVEDGDNTEVIKTNASLKELEVKNFELHLLVINASRIKKISIYPIFKLESGKEVAGPLKDEYTVSSTSSGISSCTPYCPLGAVCGSDGCGGSCGTCSGSTPNCINYQCSAQVCTPSCLNKQCGSDGCDGDCGTCLLANAVASCSASYQCVILSCNLGYANCDSNITNGCETLLGTTLNCASCGNACLIGQTCTNYVCTNPVANCSDGIQNQGETGIDCGGPCPACPTYLRTFYVSNSGNDNNNGTTPSSPWRTIAKVNSQTFLPGDGILFKRGDEWREQLTISQSGTSGLPITFSAYGTGAKPIFNGANIITGWSNEGGNVWSANCPTGLNSYMVILNNLLFTHVATLGEVTSASKYFIDYTPNPDKVYVYSTTDPNTQTAEVSARNYGIISKQLYLTISNLEVRNAGNGGITLYHSGVKVNSYSIINNVTAYRNRLKGISIADGYGQVLVTNCVATYNGNNFLIWGTQGTEPGSEEPGSDNILIEHCYSSNAIHDSITTGVYTDGSGFQLFNSDNSTIEYCESSNDPYGIALDPWGNEVTMTARYNYVHDSKSPNSDSEGIGIAGNLVEGGIIQVYYNLIVNCGSAEGFGFGGYSHHTGGSILVYNNMIYNNASTGPYGNIFFIYGNNYVFKNNIIVSEYADYKRLIYIVYSGIPVSDYNQFYQPDGSAQIRFAYNGTNYGTLASWVAGTGLDTHSAHGDPLFVNKTSDWRLQPGSPAINAGVDVGLTKDYLGNPIVGLPDIGAYERQ